MGVVRVRVQAQGVATEGIIREAITLLQCDRRQRGQTGEYALIRLHSARSQALVRVPVQCGKVNQ